jgi:flavin reductase (DIM6/NTAB) family NADH-FMN oxidoreductase RutF
MASIPTCVGVVCIELKGRIFGCTISSFISLSVEEDAERVLFVLKSDSQTGLRLKEAQNFTVNILGASQSEMARAAGGGLTSDELTDYLIESSESTSSGLSAIRNSVIGFELFLEHTINVENAELFICKVMGLYENQQEYSTPMVYLTRKFGHFEPND